MAEPIIIIGAARSGTKFLRDLLAVDANLARVPYDVNYVWRIGQQGFSHDVLSPQSLTQNRIATIRSTIATLAEREGTNSNARILEKTVSNCLRVPYVDRIFPDAKYIHLVRDGRAVVESSYRLWQSPPDSGSIAKKLRELPLSSWGYVPWFALNYVRGRIRGRTGGEVWGPRYPGVIDDAQKLPLIDVVIRQWVESVSRATAALKALPHERVLTIKYEDLIASEEHLQNVCEFVAVQDYERVARRFGEVAQPAFVDKWRVELDEGARERVESAGRELLRHYGYLR